MRKVEKLASGRWKVRYRLDGKQTSQSWPPDQRKQAAAFASLLDNVKDPQDALDILYEEQTAAQMPTMDVVAADHIGLLTDVTDGTRLNYTRLWKRTWGQKFGDTPANRLTADRIKLATLELSADYSHKSLKNQRGLLAGVCDRAVDLGYLPTNPTKGLRLPRAGEHQRQDMRILTPTEFATILEQTHPHYRPFVRFLAGTGARWGEAVALQVQDVALPNVRIRRGLKWSPDNNRVVGPTKTRRGNRTVALPSEVQDDVAAASEGMAGDQLVFTAPRGGPIQHRTFWSDIWLPACDGITPRPRIHDLRHTHAAWLLAAGVPIHVVQARLGHESITTTVDTYGGLLPDAQVAAAAAADAVFASSGDAIRGKPAPPPLG